MMAKTQRATDKLNVAISSISSAASVMGDFVEGLALDSDAKGKLKLLTEQIDTGVSQAYAALRTIRAAAESI